jgi:hypothetical protein
MKKLLSFKFWLKLSLISIFIIFSLFASLLGILNYKQDLIVQRILKELNTMYKGEIVITGSHISPFANFPYISVDLEKLKIYEDKSRKTKAIVSVNDAYLGFDFWTILNGDYKIKSIKLKKGVLNIIQHEDGSLNINRALEMLDSTKTEKSQEEFNLDLKSIKIVDVDLHKYNESTKIDLDAFIDKATARLKIKNEHTLVALDSKFEFNVIVEGDTSFIKQKHFKVNTNLDYNSKNQILDIAKSKLSLEMGDFDIEGKVDFDNDMYVDLKLNGAKPNFDLLIAFAPNELIPTLKSYDNKGKIYFNAEIKGKTANASLPMIKADFGCEKGLIANKNTKKKFVDMAFKGHFYCPENGQLSDMEFELEDFNAKPDVGIFKGNLKVKNFISPDIDLKLKADFNLEFLAKFFNLKNLEDIDGSIALKMNFHDIIDFQNPEKSIEKLNESYYTELLVRDLTFRSSKYYLPIKNVNVKAKMEGHKAVIEYCKGQIGKSDLSITGFISDLPAILHHTDDKIETDLNIESKLIDLSELTFDDKTKKSKSNEQIKDLSLKLAFISSARAFTESPNLPVGEFLIRDFHASFKNYPHKLHDFHADIFIENDLMKIVDFTGFIDGTDFHFTGKMKNYAIMLQSKLKGDTEIDFNLTADHLRLEDLFSYNGENFVPEDYRHEDFKKLKLHGITQLHFDDNGFKSMDLNLDQLSCTMQIHQCRFEKFNGRIHYESEHLVVESLKGQICQNDLDIHLHYYLGKDEKIKKRDNFFALKSKNLNVDQLINYNPPTTKKSKAVDHEAVFNIFNVPFTDFKTNLEIKNLTYHKYKLQDVEAKMRMTKNHYIYFDECRFKTAGGSFDIGGYFNGSNPKEIYFSPEIYVENADLDKLMLKFENFGQDHLISENLHGQISCGIKGKIRMHADLVPIIDKSEFTLDVEILNGVLENYKPVEIMSDYFKDKNLSKIRFDTLSNRFEFKNNTIYIPNMTINSSLGFLEIWGEQNMNMNMDFYFKIPLKLVTQAAFQKLFKRKKEEVDLDKEDAIQYQDKDKKIAYVHVNLSGNMEDYKITLKRDKKIKKENKWRRKKVG